MLGGRYPGRYCSGTVLGGDIFVKVFGLELNGKDSKVQDR